MALAKKRKRSSGRHLQWPPQKKHGDGMMYVGFPSSAGVEVGLWPCSNFLLEVQQQADHCSRHSLGRFWRGLRVHGFLGSVMEVMEPSFVGYSALSILVLGAGMVLAGSQTQVTTKDACCTPLLVLPSGNCP